MNILRWGMRGCMRWGGEEEVGIGGGRLEEMECGFVDEVGSRGVEEGEGMKICDWKRMGR